MTTLEQLNKLAAGRILILDGAMGSLIKNLNLTETDFRGSRFAAHTRPLAGCNDLLCLTRPDLISSLHEKYLQAGADIIETCSFNATAVSLADYGIGEFAREISAAAAALARKAADTFSTGDKPRFVAGSMGPTAKSAAIPPDISDTTKRSIAWDELEAAYYDNARGLLDGGADMLLVETVFDSLNAKAALFAISRLQEERRGEVPVMVSATVYGAAGRLLTGQTVEAFYNSVSHAKPWAVGLNCSFGAKLLKPHIEALAAIVPCLVSAYPNAGMPNQAGDYDETPESMAADMADYMREGLVNIAGGCCGTTPAHIAALADKAKNFTPRPVPVKEAQVFPTGLDPSSLRQEEGFAVLNTLNDTTENSEFKRLISEDDYDEAAEIIREMIEDGAKIVTICVDGAPDAEKAMAHFLHVALSYPDLAEMPIMLESARWEVIEAGLKCLPGKGIVNTVRPGEGEEESLCKAKLAHRYGAAVLVDLGGVPEEKSEGRSATIHRFSALLRSGGIPPEDIIFV
jgi:5-methyltetrahydrofolate--homocysteine methyltransferase